MHCLMELLNIHTVYYNLIIVAHLFIKHNMKWKGIAERLQVYAQFLWVHWLKSP